MTLHPFCAVCGHRAVHDHHVLTRQELKKHGGKPEDKDNLLSLCHHCHMNHHGIHKIDLAFLRDENYNYAFALMGPKAQDYLRRYYDGADSRLEELAV